ncbi:MAG: biotin-dependent carboxyltransferase family protein [Acidimicrobiia bacterium]|nr:biotin-dependent carboxyltransferase family protein [Acidimicrobiia bacterium]
MSGLDIVEVGFGTTLQDHGRFGYADLGVPRAGAVDRRAHDLANRLVGNHRDAATIETMRGLVIEARSAAVVASSGDGALRTLRAGDRMRVDAPLGEMWAYLAVRGGFDVAKVLGSRSRDTLSGLGPPDPVAGDRLSIGPDPGTEMPADLAPHDPPGTDIHIWDGPQHSWFGPTNVLIGDWSVTSEVSRVGVRLEPATDAQREGAEMAGGPSVEGRIDAQRIRAMSSEGLLEGAVQITPSGQPIVMLSNHPTTGGYPVAAVVDRYDISDVAQARPGAVLRFRPA